MAISSSSTVRIGRTSPIVWRIGLGTASLAAGAAYKAGAPVGQELAGAVIHAALSREVRFPLEEGWAKHIWTSQASYGISTTVGRYLTADGGTSFDCTRKGILYAVEASVQRLRLMSVDMLLLHDPNDFYHEALDVAFPALVESHHQGVARGLSAQR